ncbi:uroporphyrinogen-III synthase [Tsuneonella rigui]|uniref:uroporphyrinogen-III synthase n=1 Tax=Tsuneonella rigui TaxID=1708790 RepID=UPI000F7E6C91|nr:uroporphyrinogen-III synthase [Tsuneonella rigui]
MSKPLIVLRPEPGLSETLALAQAKDLTAIAAPLFEIEPVAWRAPDPADLDGILAGSANVFRHGGLGLSKLSALPVHAVGERTAQAALEAGFTVANVGAGGLQQVLDTLPAPARLLRLAGEQHVALQVPDGSAMTEVIVYRARAVSLSETAVEALRSDAVVLLHSGEAAARFAGECDRLSIDRSRVSVAALAPRVAAAAGEGWRAVAVAPQATDAALLAMADDMCQ